MIDLAAALDRAPGVVVGGAHGLATPLLLARLARQQGPVLAVAAGADRTDALAQDLRVVLGDAAAVRLLNDEDSTPFGAASASSEIMGERLGTLMALATGEGPRVLVVNAAALMRRGLELTRLGEATRLLVAGDSPGRDALALHLHRCGFARVPLVEDPGTYAVRGSLIDLFPPGRDRPLRIDLFGDAIDSIRAFDPATQRNLAPVQSLAIGPIREVLFDADAVATARTRLRALADDINFPSRKLGALLHDIDAGIPFFGVGAVAPAFSATARPALAEQLGELLGERLRVVLIEGQAVREHLEQTWHQLEDDAAEAVARGRLVFPPDDYAVRAEPTWRWLQARARGRFELLPLEPTTEVVQINSAPTSDLTRDIQHRAKAAATGEAPEDLFAPVKQHLDRLRRDGVCSLVLVRGSGGAQRIQTLLRDHAMEPATLAETVDLLDPGLGAAHFKPSVHAHLLALPSLPSSGAVLPGERLAIFTEDDFFGRRARRQGDHRAPFRTALSDLNDGDVVVHVDFGVGLYRGLTRLNVRGVEADYLLITYRDDDKLYLPVTRINLIQRYAGSEDHHPRLDKLGGQTWARTKSRVKQAILAMAQELLAIYARREVSPGVAYPAPDALYRDFEGRFPFDETPDQARAIQDVLADLQRPRPMDRLVCGDVGYGKTEVAMRAAMLAVLGGKQVAVLAPTTVLAQQHHLTFSERFAGFPVKLEVISRLRRSGETSEALARVRAGEVDILIGTHRLLSHDVGFADLGLLVIDEEHRFGVKDKERIKALRASVDVLSMSATPIPRTLQMGFFGLRDLSIIDTAPTDRRAIRTSVVRFDQRVIRDAIQQELDRGGQVYFVHNRIQSIAPLAGFVQRLIPTARVAVAHGQMNERELERVMLEFIRGELHVLVCTAIIESGLDIPRANTILINRADRFGLAQLYQLRGRVGRSRERAFAYLLVPPSSTMTPKARRRLEILTRFAELGAGFKIAQQDLELRGAGDLLGRNQHGHVAAVGYEMYAELLAEAVRELQGRAVETVPEPELNVHVPAFLPEDYVPEVHERLAFYQRMATAAEPQDVYEVLTALEDRYGEAPPPARTLCEVMVLKVKLKAVAARAVDLVAPGEDGGQPARVVVSLGDSTHLDPARIAAWIAEQPARVRLTPQMKLYLSASPADWLAANEDMVELARRFLDEVQQRAGRAS